MSAGIAGARRQELREALRRFVDLALETKAAVVTIGGDLYEHERATLDTGNFIKQQCERLAPARVLIAPGNHDPYLSDSLYRRIEWPANVTIFGEPRFRPLAVAPGVTLWGAGHDAPALRQDLLSGFHTEGDGLHLLLFHGSDARAVPEGKAAHCPFLPEEIPACGAQFALVGHYHAARLYPLESPVMAYPGTPEPLDFSEEGEHFVLRVTISESVITPELVPFGRVSYRTERIDVSAMPGSDEIRTAVIALGGEGAIVRVILRGQLMPEAELDLDLLHNSCVEHFAYLDVVDRTEPPYNFEELAEESTTQGAFVRLMQSRMRRLAGEELAVARTALVYGLRAFGRREIGL